MKARYLLLYHIIISLSIMGALAPVSVFAQTQTTQIPGSLDQAKTMGGKALSNLPEALKSPWQSALKVWGGMYDWGKARILPWLNVLWQKIKAPLTQEIEKRKPGVEKEFQKQTKEITQEIKTEAPKAGKSIWERFKELIK